MINRDLIRLKVVQIIYAYYQNGDRTIDNAEKELMFSLSKAYDLYNLLLLLMVDINKRASLRVEVEERKNARLNTGVVVNRKFVDNKFINQLESNKMLQDFQENKKKNWDNEENFLRTLLEQIQQSETYTEYMAGGESTYEEDRELWRKIYKNFICKNEDLDAVLEEMSLYWNDDKEIVDTFVLKTIKRFEESNGADQELLPEYKDNEDMEFASRLLRRSILNGEYYQHLMGEHSKNWELNRLAFMDVVIMQIALAEITSFPNIPISVSINEYVEIAKLYSTPKSGSYVNAMLDHIAKALIKEKKLIK